MPKPSDESEAYRPRATRAPYALRVSPRSKRIAALVACVCVVALVWSLAIVTNEKPATTHDAHVSIQNYMFAPVKLVVRPGEAIVVTNHDVVVHTLTSIDELFNTGRLAPGDSATILAPTKPGTYDYICTVHRYMYGEIVVK